MTPLTWPCPLRDGTTTDEYALSFDHARARRLLIVPALFDEANRLRRLTVEVMRRLDGAGIDSVLPDLPGTNESLQPLEIQEPQDWSNAMAAAASHFGATHVLGIRGGCLFTPAGFAALHYAPAKAPGILRQMLRARTLAAREAGREETREGLMHLALTQGIELVGHRLGPEFVRRFETFALRTDAVEITQETLGGSGLWLRAEPGESASQADALAAAIARALA
ncbi:hypothetical protein HNO88_001834 [Novosphingobium chloroacetimidivorans]|uniref:Uncharacterized protein n=1 Tax=Novosphingobium chloroacetimidivorans TaxID=1428314 RepID=A0A7W7K9N4_9SPHN|nr:hypothetical protein [Novosphingobium chloroacetimidivorans]MBB4858511.1 hypothetical protein [Novosphingobium chloroacetimidivorans]